MPTKEISKPIKTKVPKAVRSKESLNKINPDKHPHAYAANKKLKEAKENGTYMTTDKLKKSATPASFTKERDRPKKFTSCEAFADYIGWEIVDGWVEKAKTHIEAGDISCLLFMLERCFPKGKATRKIKSSIRDLVTLEDMHKAYTLLINETAAGDIDIDDAKTLSDIIAKKESVLSASMMEEIESKLAEFKKHILQ